MQDPTILIDGNKVAIFHVHHYKSVIYHRGSQPVCRDTLVCRDATGGVSRKSGVSLVCREELVCRDTPILTVYNRRSCITLTCSL